jgi:hypothetical protein
MSQAFDMWDEDTRMFDDFDAVYMPIHPKWGSAADTDTLVFSEFLAE